MFEFEGKYSSCKVFSNHIESSAQIQIMQFLNSTISKNSHPRWMPDIHAGMGCTIGTTFYVNDKIVPNFVGVDIGCGMYIIKLVGINKINFASLDEFIRNEVPYGTGGINSEPNELFQEAYKQIKTENPELFD